jgi:hypothetical protein
MMTTKESLLDLPPQGKRRHDSAAMSICGVFQSHRTLRWHVLFPVHMVELDGTGVVEKTSKVYNNLEGLYK